MGRPSKFTQAIADTICERLADGESLRSICAEDGMPRTPTVLRWLANDEAFRSQYARARDAQADTLAEQILEIADDASADYDVTPDGPKLIAEHVQRSRLRVDARKWLASKLAPKKYGDRQIVEGTMTVRHEDALSELE